MIAHAHLKIQTAFTETAVVDCKVALILFQRLDKRTVCSSEWPEQKVLCLAY
jgi:hypothetical protein